MPRKGKSSKLPIPLPPPSPSDVQSYDELVRILNEIEVTLFEEETDTKKGVKVINDLLATIERLLLRVFFAGYQNWLSTPNDSEKRMPTDVVLVGEKIHKLILSRGKFILDVLKERLEDANKKAERGQDLLKLPAELQSFFDSIGGDEEDEAQEEEPPSEIDN